MGSVAAAGASGSLLCLLVQVLVVMLLYPVELTALLLATLLSVVLLQSPLVRLL